MVREAIIMFILLGLLFNRCSTKKTFSYNYDTSIPDTIEKVFLSQYSMGLEQYTWKKDSKTFFEVYFRFNQDNKIATYDTNACLVKMQTEVPFKGKLLETFNKSLNEDTGVEVKKCFWVVTKDSIYHNVYYKDSIGDHTVSVFVPGIPEL